MSNRGRVTKELLIEILEGIELAFYAPDIFLTPGQRRRKHELLRKRRRALYDLTRRGYVEREGRGREMNVSLTERGEMFARYAKLEKLRLPHEAQWDGKWRLVMFDIPEKKKVARESLRRKFRHLGMKQAQKSIFAYPFDCQDEIDLVADVFGVKPYIRYALATTLRDDGDLRAFFGV